MLEDKEIVVDDKDCWSYAANTWKLCDDTSSRKKNTIYSERQSAQSVVETMLNQRLVKQNGHGLAQNNGETGSHDAYDVT